MAATKLGVVVACGCGGVKLASVVPVLFPSGEAGTEDQLASDVPCRLHTGSSPIPASFN